MPIPLLPLALQVDPGSVGVIDQLPWRLTCPAATALQAVASNRHGGSVNHRYQGF